MADRKVCHCGRPVAERGDLEAFNGAAQDCHGHPYLNSPSTWQKVVLGLCLAPDASHEAIPRDHADLCWSLGDVCRLPQLEDSFK